MNTGTDLPSKKIKPAPRHRVHRQPIGNVHVLRDVHESRLVAVRAIPAGARLFRIDGRLTDRPSRYSVQVDQHVHLEPDIELGAGESSDRYHWRFMNHSCDPNAVIEGREIVACRDMEPGDAVTFDYNTTEWEIAEPFLCRCGSAKCLKEIRGYKSLTLAQRAALRGIAPHLAHAGRSTARIVEPPIA
jgi:hypothetical protein